MSYDTLTPRVPKEPLLFGSQGSMNPKVNTQQLPRELSSESFSNRRATLWRSPLMGPVLTSALPTQPHFGLLPPPPQPFSFTILCMRPDHRVGQVGGEGHQGDAQPHLPCHCLPGLPTALHHSYLFQIQNNSPSSSLEPSRPLLASNGKSQRWVEKLPGPPKIWAEEMGTSRSLSFLNL